MPAVAAPRSAGAVSGPDRYETHVSVVWRSGDLAYKRKKPVRTPFLDYSTPQRREVACGREVALNRRLSPDVYLGVEHLDLGPDLPAEPAVVMRWLPESTRLDRVLSTDPDAGRAALRSVARQLAALHTRSAAVLGEHSPGGWEATRRRWAKHLAALADVLPHVVQGREIAALGNLASRFLAGRQALFTRRVEAGQVRDGHGDLRCDQVFVSPDGPRILDCIEFDDALRIGDVLLDAAFLAMDLEWLGRPELSQEFLTAFEEFTGWPQPRPLRDFFVAERALVRAEVSGLRARQTGRPDHEGPGHVLIAAGHLRRALPRLILVGGLPGSGKTTLAERVAAGHGAQLLASDVIRKELAGLPAVAPAASEWQTGIYSPRHTSATYAVMLERARVLLANGESVVLDATWADPVQRRRALRLASESVAMPICVECRVPDELAERRLRARTASVSDADVAIRRRMHQDWQTRPPLTPVSTVDLDVAERYVDRLLVAAVSTAASAPYQVPSMKESA